MPVLPMLSDISLLVV